MAWVAEQRAVFHLWEKHGWRACRNQIRGCIAWGVNIEIAKNMKEYYRKENGVIRYYPDGVPSVPAEVVAEKPKKESKKSKK